MKTVVFDFDGVIHSYMSGWKGADVIPDPPVNGIKEAIDKFIENGYEVVVVSTRCTTFDGLEAVKDYLKTYGIKAKVMAEKPPAVCYIDDRAVCFDGHPEKLFDIVDNFKPWNRKEN